MATPLDDAIASLEEQKKLKLAEVEALEKAIKNLQEMILVVSPGQLPRSQEYSGLGITEAAKRWLREVGEPRGTREIADAVRERGLTTKSKNFTATVFATLTNSRDFHRTKDGTWELVEKKG